MTSNELISKIGSSSGSGKTSKLPLKPIQPTQYWTFENALSLIKHCQDPYILEALNEFLLLSQNIITTPLPFKNDPNHSSKINSKTREISIRGILYTDITEQNIKDAEEIRKILPFDLDMREIVRVISQTSKKVPSKNTLLSFDGGASNYIKSKLSDDKEHRDHARRLTLYIWSILREQRIILKIACELLFNKTDEYASTVIRNLGKEIFLSKDYISSLISSIQLTIEVLLTGSYLTGRSEDVDDTIANETVLFCIQSCKILFEVALQNPLIDKENVTAWFTILKKTDFGVALGPKLKYHESYEELQALFSAITIEFLDLENSYDSVSDENQRLLSFVVDPNVFNFINDIVTSSYCTNSVIMFAWKIILLRKFYFYQEFPNAQTSKAFENVFSNSQMQIAIADLDSKLTTLEVYLNLQRINKILCHDKSYLAVISTVITSSMSLLELTPEISDCIANVMRNCPNDVIESFFTSEATTDAIILSRAKFPLLISPYLKLASINGNFALHEFNYLKSYIQDFEKDEFDRIYQIDDQDPNLVRIKEDVFVAPPFESNKKMTICLETGTKAKLLPSSKPGTVLVTFLYQYNGWAFLGRLLQNILKLNKIDPLQEVVLIDILNLMYSVAVDNTDDGTELILEAMSAYTDQADVVELILRLLELSLRERNVKLLTTIVRLLTSLVPFASDRIWSHLRKSSLFAMEGGEGRARAIFNAIELVNGNYSFSLSIIQLAQALVSQSISLSINSLNLNIREQIMTNIVSHLIFLFENFSNCRFNVFLERLEMGVLLFDIFSTILTTTYGIKKFDQDYSKKGIVGQIFHTAAKSILDSFLAVDVDCASSAAAPILNTLGNVASNLDLYELADTSGFWYDTWIRCCFSFAQLLLDYRTYLNLEPSALEKALYHKAADLVTIFATLESYGKIVLDLLSSLIKSGNWKGKEGILEPSLLSHLGTYNAQILKDTVAAGLNNTFDDYKMKIAIHDFICAVMTSNQEGLVVFFHTGKDAFITTKKDGTDKKGEIVDRKEKTLGQNNNSLIQLLKKNVREMKYYPNSVSIHLVDALALACNSWTTVREYKHDDEFIESLIDRIKLQITGTPTSPEAFISRCYEIKLVAKIADILALYLFTTKNEKCRKKIIDFVNSDDFVEIAEKKFVITHYQPTLYANLQNSFEQAFPNLELSQFLSKPPAKRNRIGVNVIYNLALMDEFFKNEKDWVLIREQLIASSINLQFVTSQLESAKSFSVLITSFCRRYEGAFNEQLLSFANFLLLTNVKENNLLDQFKEIYFERIELSFYLIYSFFVTKDKSKVLDIVVFDVIKSLSYLLSSRLQVQYHHHHHQETFSVEDPVRSKELYRLLLKTIYSALSLIKDNIKVITDFLSVFGDLFDSIVIKGIRLLSLDIQNEVYYARLGEGKVNKLKIASAFEDLQLILSILKVFTGLKSHGVIFMQKIVELIDESSTVKTLLHIYANSLYPELDDEFAIAQLSLEFLRQLMSIPALARSIVSAGLYIALLESPVSRVLRNGGMSITNEPKHYHLWVDGLLPIIITNISAVGPSIFPEVCVVLRLLSKQVEYALGNWARGEISTAAVAETSQLLVIYDLLNSVEVPAEVKISIGDFPGLNTEEKREELVESLNNLTKHPKYLRSRIAKSNPHQVIDDDVVNSIVVSIREMANTLN